jgi:hypothetical protein
MIGPIERAKKLLAQGDRHGAAKVLAPIIEGNGDDLEAWWLFAQALEGKQARYAVDQVLRLQPDHREAQLMRVRLEPSPVDEFPFPDIMPPSLLKKPAPAKARRSTLPTLPLVARIVILLVMGVLAVGILIFGIISFNRQQQMNTAADQLDRAIMDAGAQNYQILYSAVGDSSRGLSLYCFITTPVEAQVSGRRYENATRFLVTYSTFSESWIVQPRLWSVNCPAPGDIFGG